METTNQKKSKKKSNSRHSKAYTLLLILMMLLTGGFLVMLMLVDAFPPDMLKWIIGVMAGLLFLSAILIFRKKRWLRVIGLLFSILFITVSSLGIYYMGNTYAMFARITSEDKDAEVAADSVDVTDKPFNLYITGIDMWNKEKGLDLERSDVNMIVTVNPVTRKIILTSIPRDAYVPLHRTGTMDKLTHTGIYGVDETLNTVEDWLGLDLNYYVKANFNACVDLVEAIGGIDIYNPVEFRSALTNHLYPKGDIHLKGYGALYYARERKAFEGEDQLRVKNQLRVMEAILHKLLTSSTLLTSYADIMNVLGDEVSTNMPKEDIQALVKMQLSDLSAWDIKSQRMSGDYDMAIVASMDPSNEYQVLMVDPKTLNKCLDGINEVMNPTEEELEAIVLENKRKSAITFIKGLISRDESDQAEAEDEGSKDKKSKDKKSKGKKSKEKPKG